MRNLKFSLFDANNFIAFTVTTRQTIVHLSRLIKHIISKYYKQFQQFITIFIYLFLTNDNHSLGIADAMGGSVLDKYLKK